MEELCTLTTEGEGDQTIASQNDVHLNNDQCRVEKCKLDTTGYISQCSVRDDGSYIYSETEDDFCTEREINGEDEFRNCRNEADDGNVAC